MEEHLLFVIGRITPSLPKDVHALIPSTCEYITKHGKRDFADGIDLHMAHSFIQEGINIADTEAGAVGKIVNQLWPLPS